MSPIAAAAPDSMISPADVQRLADTARSDALAFVETNKVAVTDQATLIRAKNVRVAIGGKQKEIIAQLAKPKGWANMLHKWFCSLESAALVPYEILDTYEREQIRTYNDRATQIREANERQIAEARRREEQDRAAAVAAAFEADHEPQMAEAIIAEAIAAPMPVVVLPDEVREVQKFRRVWKWRLVDAQLVPREYLTIDDSKVGGYVRSMRESGNIPGIDIYYVDEPLR